MRPVCFVLSSSRCAQAEAEAKQAELARLAAEQKDAEERRRQEQALAEFKAKAVSHSCHSSHGWGELMDRARASGVTAILVMGPDKLDDAPLIRSRQSNR